MIHLKSISVLLADDNEDHSELMIDAFLESNNKNKIYRVSDGEQVMSFLTNQAPFDNQTVYPEPDLICLDIRMPKQDGVETLEKIKNNEDLKHIPVTIISTTRTPEEIQECYRLGACGYITKPVDFDDFLFKIKKLNFYWSSISELPSK